MNYLEFLARKRIVDPMTGMADVGELPTVMKPHQRDITSWALRRGRAAIFAGTGLGKTLMELTWASRVAAHTGKPVLGFAPLAVAPQHIREGEKFGIETLLAKIQDDIRNGVYVSNYQKIEHFDLDQFGGVVLDESSILKSTTGHYRTRLIEECAQIPFRLAATATPAPNDFMELGNHAEFLGVMKYTDMLATFFTHDGGDTQKWRLKGHAENEFWKWMASWAVMIRKPSDLGYDDAGYDLPPLRQNQHTVGVEYAPSMETGLLFPMEANSLQERIAARRDTVEERINCAISIVTADFRVKLSECLGNLNTNQTDSIKLAETLNTVLGSKLSEAELLKKIANICAPTTAQTKTNGKEPQNKKKPETPPVGMPTCQQAHGNGPVQKLRKKPKLDEEIAHYDQLSASGHPNMMPSLLSRAEDAQFAEREAQIREGLDCTSTIAMTLEKSEGFCALPVTSELESSKTTGTGSLEQSNISLRPILNRWVIWCQLNSEQDALKRAFGELCFSVSGSDTEDEKEASILGWLDGERPILLTKPSICGFGLNFQCCQNTIFVGLNDSFEQVYQAIRRFWRFGQTMPVNVHFIAAETEGAVVANLRRKEADAERMAAAMVAHMADLSAQNVRGMVRDRPDYEPKQPMIIPSWLEVA